MTEATIVKFDAEKKNDDLNPRQIRAEGKVPATIYGKGMDSVSIQLDTHSFVIAYRDNQDSVFELNLDGKKYNVVVQHVQKNYATNETLNVEFKLV